MRAPSATAFRAQRHVDVARFHAELACASHDRAFFRAMLSSDAVPALHLHRDEKYLAAIEALPLDGAFRTVHILDPGQINRDSGFWRATPVSEVHASDF